MKTHLIMAALLVTISSVYATGQAEDIGKAEEAAMILESKATSQGNKRASKKGKKKEAAASNKKQNPAAETEDSFKDDVVMEHPFDMRSMEKNEIEIVKNNLNDFFRHNKTNEEGLKAATTKVEKLIIFERIRESNACLMQRYGDNLKKLKKDFYSLLIFLNDKKVSEDPKDKDFMEAASSTFWLINRFGEIVREYSALK